MTSFIPNATHDGSLPNQDQVFVDVVEWWCHTILHEPPGPQFERRCKQLQHLSAHFSIDVPPFGRLRNRLLICATAQGICGRSIVGDSESCDALTAQDWKSLLQELQECRTSMLRMDHNDGRGYENDRVDEDLEHLPIFSEAYEEVVSLYHLQIAICEFRDGLQKMIQNPPTSINKQLERLLEDYKAGIPDDLQAGDLLTFVQNDLLKAGPKKTSAKENAALLEKLLAHLNTVMTKNDTEYSYHVLQIKLLELLNDWCDGNLKHPELVMLGYGGLPPIQHADGNDKHTVSSWGMDEAEREERRKIERGDNMETTGEDNQDESAHAIDDSDDSDDFYTAASLPETQQNMAATSFSSSLDQGDSDTELEEVPEEEALDVTPKVANKHDAPQGVPIRVHDFSTTEAPQDLKKVHRENNQEIKKIEFQGDQDYSESENLTAAEMVQILEVSPARTKNVAAMAMDNSCDDFSDISFVEESECNPSRAGTVPTRNYTVPGCMVLDEEDVIYPGFLRDGIAKNGDEKFDLDHGEVEPIPFSVFDPAPSIGEEGIVSFKGRPGRKNQSHSFTHDSDDDGILGVYEQGATRKRQKITSSCYALPCLPQVCTNPASFKLQKEAIRKGYESYGEDWSTIRAHSNCLMGFKAFQIKHLCTQMIESGEIIWNVTDVGESCRSDKEWVLTYLQFWDTVLEFIERTLNIWLLYAIWLDK